MNKTFLGRLRYLLTLVPYKLLDPLYVFLDRQFIRRSRNIRLIPAESDRRGGKYSYVEWGHVVGIFQTLIMLHLERKEGNAILDVGSGTGLLSIASEPFIGNGGRYFGIDVMARDVNFCRRHFDPQRYHFEHLDAFNAEYSPDQSDRLPWSAVDTEAFDLVISVSVWTHFNEEDGRFYFREVARALKPGAKAIISFFILDEVYEESLSRRGAGQGRFHSTAQRDWIFDTPAYGSDAWFCTKWSKVPEAAIGVTSAGLERLLADSGLRLLQHYQGNWKEAPGVYFQDVLVFEKPQ
jgi:SAM-dependent methyltransferase